MEKKKEWRKEGADLGLIGEALGDQEHVVRTQLQLPLLDTTLGSALHCHCAGSMELVEKGLFYFR